MTFGADLWKSARYNNTHMSHALTDDHFLAKIQDTEKEAQKKLTKAKKKLADDLAKHEQKLQKSMHDKLEKSREKAKEKLKAKQADARKTYEKQTEEGARSVAQLEKDSEGTVGKQIPLAQAFFLELLG